MNILLLITVTKDLRNIKTHGWTCSRRHGKERWTCGCRRVGSSFHVPSRRDWGPVSADVRPLIQTGQHKGPGDTGRDGSLGLQKRTNCVKKTRGVVCKVWRRSEKFGREGGVRV